MKRFTQREFDAIERVKNGYKHIPAGDWTKVDFDREVRLIFAAGCILGEGCELGRWCILGDGCTLGDDCVLGDGCKLGNRCTLGDWCELGDNCTLGDACTLGGRCVLGNGCTLGNGCKLGNRCVLGDGYMLGSGCSFEGGRVNNAVFFKTSNIGIRDEVAYAYCDTHTGAIFVRVGCWFSDLDKFVERVHEEHGGTVHEKDYMAFADFARARFAKYQGGSGQYKMKGEEAYGTAD